MSEIDPIKLMVWHLEALYTRDDRGRIIAVNERNGGPAPRLFLGRTRDGDVWSVRQDQPEWLRTAVAGMLGGSDPVEHGCPGSERLAELEKLLGRAGRVERKWTGPAFLVPDQVEGDGAVVRIESDNCYLLDPLLSAWIPDVAAGVPMSASIVEGRAVSLCCSARITPEAHEAGLETHPDFRGLGHAGLVTVGWSRAVRELGAIPLYSTSVENMASLRVAEKLGLEQFGTDFHLT